MKTAILTFQDTNNFGACLQALALYLRVRQMGDDVEILNYHNPRIYWNEVLNLRPSLNPRRFARWLLYTHKDQKKYRMLHSEMRSMTKFSKNEFFPSNIQEADIEYDRFLVGSDQVWALNVTDYDYTYFLDFVTDKNKKFAFASSISNENAFRNDKKAQQLIRGFKSIAVREEEAKDVINETTGIDVPWVGDPTMLFSSQEWDQIIKPKEYPSDYVFIYFTDPNLKIIKDAIEYAKRNNCRVLYCNTGKRIKGTESISLNTMAEWVGMIKHAKALFTASYHGMLFGLYYNKQLAYYNRNQKSRMQSLSKLVGIEKNDGSMISDGIIPLIDYPSVNRKLSKCRMDSNTILKEMLQI